MPRTAITVTQSSKWLTGDNPTATTGDAANDHSVTTSDAFCLVAMNYNAATVDFEVTLPSCNATWRKARSISDTIPAAVAGVPGVVAIWFDVPDQLKQSDETWYISSADGNFGDVRLFAITPAVTPR